MLTKVKTKSLTDAQNYARGKITESDNYNKIIGNDQIKDDPAKIKKAADIYQLATQAYGKKKGEDEDTLRSDLEAKRDESDKAA
ncbi:MAG: hypothetical protein NY202_05195 [Mollicutes bacterium UO1]